MRRRYVGAVLALFGAVILSIPFFVEWKENEEQQKLLKSWNEMRSDSGEKEQEGHREELQPVEQAVQRKGLDKVFGILSIPAIELEQPVLKEADTQSLKISLTVLGTGGIPGQPGNISIAGHNSRTYGRHFNRLTELQEGDEVILQTVDGDYSYQVTECFIVEESDVWVLNESKRKQELTLITCYYPEEGNTQRYIVRAERSLDEG